MKRLKLTKILTTLILVLSIIFQVGNAYASDDDTTSEKKDGTVIVHLGEVQDILDKNNANDTTITEDELINRKLTLWKIDDTNENLINYDDQINKLEELNAIDNINKLNELYPKSYNATTYIEDGNLYAKTDPLPQGVYYVKGYSDNDNERLDLDSFLVLMPSVNGEYDYEIYPKDNSSITITKVDEDDTSILLEGAEFKLYRSDGTPVKTTNGVYDKDGKEEILTTDKDGTITITSLPNDSYYFEEIKAPEGYVITNEKTDVTIPNDKQITITNKKVTGKYKFKKISSKDNNPLEHAQFIVQRKNDKGKYENIIKPGSEKDNYIVESNKDGLFEVDNLPIGETFYLQELKAPDGYIKLTDRIEFTIDGKDEKEKVLVIENKPGTPPGPNEPNSPKRISVPKTGDIVIFVLALAGALFVIMGIKMIRTKDNNSAA